MHVECLLLLSCRVMYLWTVVQPLFWSVEILNEFLGWCSWPAAAAALLFLLLSARGCELPEAALHDTVATPKLLPFSGRSPSVYEAVWPGTSSPELAMVRAAEPEAASMVAALPEAAPTRASSREIAPMGLRAAWPWAALPGTAAWLELALTKAAFVGAVKVPEARVPEAASPESDLALLWTSFTGAALRNVARPEDPTTLLEAVGTPLPVPVLTAGPGVALLETALSLQGAVLF